VIPRRLQLAQRVSPVLAFRVWAVQPCLSLASPCVNEIFDLHLIEAMAQSRVVIDALWRCLNPSVDAHFMSRATKSSSLLAYRIDGFRGICRNRCAGQVRALHVRSSLMDSSCEVVAAQSERRPAPAGSEPPHVSASQLVRQLLRSDIVHIYPRKLRPITTPVIYEALRALRNHSGQAGKIRQLVTYLVAERGERPNVFLYEALVTASWDTTTGSASDLVAIMKEMWDTGITPSPSFYHSALRVRFEPMCTRLAFSCPNL
jgi:hypothetical protein